MVCYGKAALGVSKGGGAAELFSSLENIFGRLARGGRGGGRLEDVFEHERHPVGGNLGERWRIILSFQMCLERL